MKQATIRLVGIVVTVLVLGTVAFAVLVAVQAPRASQIPTVVANRSSAESTAAPSLATTPAPASSSSTAKTPADAHTASQKESNSAQSVHASAASAPREVVTPKVRDDNDRSDSDDRSSPSDSHSNSHKSDSDENGGSKPQSIDRPARLRAAVSANVGRDLSPGKNVTDASD